MPSTEIIVTVHADAAGLDLSLLALSRQRGASASICVAEDGEDAAIREVVGRRRADFPAGALRHVSQPHLGFRKNRVLNLAIASSAAEYLVFLDGDCVASPRFLARHLALRKPGRFVTGGVIRLSPAATRAVTAEHVQAGRVFALDWLRAHGAGGLRNLLKSEWLPAAIAGLAERLTTVPRTWNGGNASGWRSDLVAVNGFDESLGYGGEDVDLGFRLNRMGVVGRHVRYSAAVLHLEHDRPYAREAERAANIAKVKGSAGKVPTRAELGITKP